VSHRAGPRGLQDGKAQSDRRPESLDAAGCSAGQIRVFRNSCKWPPSQPRKSQRDWRKSAFSRQRFSNGFREWLADAKEGVAMLIGLCSCTDALAVVERV
jgi:hypothetical protein